MSKKPSYTGDGHEPLDDFFEELWESQLEEIDEGEDAADEDEFDPDYKSKSQLKRESHDLQAIGTRLVKLPAPQLATIPMPEQLEDAVNLARRIKARGGLRRQMQYIGKVMRSIDPEPIQVALDRIDQSGREETAKQHAVERWRDRLIEGGDEALTDFLDEYPEADRQRIRQLVRNARKEAELNKPPASSRALFKLIREALD